VVANDECGLSSDEDELLEKEGQIGEEEQKSIEGDLKLEADSQ